MSISSIFKALMSMVPNPTHVNIEGFCDHLTEEESDHILRALDEFDQRQVSVSCSHMDTLLWHHESSIEYLMLILELNHKVRRTFVL